MFRRSLLAFGRSAALQNKSVVSISEAQKQVTSYKDLPNDILLVMSRIGDQEAKEERLIREIMAKDNTDWSASQKTFASIVASNRKGLFLATLPYKFGIGAAVSAGVLSFPMIFDINTVMLFNESFVTADIPEPKDLETPLEMENLGIKPFTHWFKSKRADRLCKEFPKYCPGVLKEFSQGDDFTP